MKMASGSFTARHVIAKGPVYINSSGCCDCHIGIYGTFTMAGPGIRIIQLAASLMVILLFMSDKVARMTPIATKKPNYPMPQFLYLFAGEKNPIKRNT